MLHLQMSRSRRLGFACFMAAVSLLAAGAAVASDHWDSSSARADQAADITDVYAFPMASKPSGKADRLVLIMSVHPYASAPSTVDFFTGKGKKSPPADAFAGLGDNKAKEPGTQFSDAVTYAFRIRPVELKGSGQDLQFVTDAHQEVLISCTFDDAILQTMTCAAQDPQGAREDLKTQVKVDDESGGTNSFIKAFAGCRADPSFIAGKEVREPHPRNSPKHLNKSKLVNPVAYTNVLSIVLNLDVDAVLKRAPHGPLLAAVAQTTRGSSQVDRMGRVFINSFVIGKMGNVLAAPPELDKIKDDWNQDDAFNLKHADEYKRALQDGLAFIDGMEISKNNENVLDWPSPHPLLNIFLNDFLVLDLGYPTTPSDKRHTLMEIELAAFNGKSHHTCGGRKPNDDIVDPWFTLLINGPNRPTPLRGDGIDHAVRPASNKFPYLAKPFSGKDRRSSKPEKASS
jgi:hypothetical protein